MSIIKIVPLPKKGENNWPVNGKEIVNFKLITVIRFVNDLRKLIPGTIRVCRVVVRINELLKILVQWRRRDSGTRGSQYFFV